MSCFSRDENWSHIKVGSINDAVQSFDTITLEFNRVGVIIGGVLGGVCGLLLLVIIFALYRKRKEARHPEDGLAKVAEKEAIEATWAERFRKVHGNNAHVPGSRVNVDLDKSIPRFFRPMPSILEISRPQPVITPRKPSQDLPFLLAPQTGCTFIKEPSTLPVAIEQGGRRKIEIPSKPVMIGAVQEETYKIRAEGGPNTNDLKPGARRLPRLSKILPPMPLSLNTSGSQTGTRRPLPIPPEDAEYDPSRMERQVVFEGVEAVDGEFTGPLAPLRKKKRQNSRWSTASTIRMSTVKQEIEELRREIKKLSKSVSAYGSPPPHYTYAI